MLPLSLHAGALLLHDPVLNLSSVTEIAEGTRIFQTKTILGNSCLWQPLILSLCYVGIFKDPPDKWVGMVKQHPYFLSSHLPVFAQFLLNPHPRAHIPKFSLLSGTHLKQVYSSFLPTLASGSTVREDSWENLIDVVIFTPASCTESYEIPPPPLSPQFLCFRETCWQWLEGWLFPIVLHDSKAKCPQGEGWPPNWWRDGDKRIPLGTKRQKYHLQNHSPLRSAEKE